ncbi:MAG: ATP-binding protein [Acidobacteriaceae bacterium]
MKKKALVSWSSGKDSAWALHVLRQRGVYEVAGLLTTMNAEFDRVAMHGTRRALLEAQADAAGLPLRTIPLPWPCSNEQYESAMGSACAEAVAEGIEVIAFGDLFLEDVRAYREEKLAGTGLTPVFPLWGLPTEALAREMLAGGLRARIVCVDPAKLPREFAGRDLDESVLDAMPAECDRCAERGEFHTVAYAGPMFRRAIPIESGEVVERDGFVFADVKVVEGWAAAAHS